MRQILTFVVFLGICGTVLAQGQAPNEALQSGCETTRLYFWDFETEPSDWSGSGWGWCHESTMVGPDGARSGEYCRGTVCDGDYGPYSEYTAKTPPILLPDISAGEQINFHFWQWYRIYSSYDYHEVWGTVEISVNYGPWEPLIDTVRGYNTDWSLAGEYLSSYAGNTVQVKFLLHTESGGYYNRYLDKGWYIDDVVIELYSFGVDAGPDKTIYEGECVQLDAVVGCRVWPYMCSWLPIEGLSNPDCQNTNACPETTTTYVITVTDDSSNTSTDTVVVIVESPTDVPPDESLLPTEFALRQNYPNPFNPSTTISYNLPQKSHVIITVFNILEQEVKTLVNETKPSGVHQVGWEGTDQSGKPVASGVYFYKFKAGDYIETRKMLLLK